MSVQNIGLEYWIRLSVHIIRLQTHHYTSLDKLEASYTSSLSPHTLVLDQIIRKDHQIGSFGWIDRLNEGLEDRDETRLRAEKHVSRMQVPVYAVVAQEHLVSMYVYGLHACVCMYVCMYIRG